MSDSQTPDHDASGEASDEELAARLRDRIRSSSVDRIVRTSFRIPMERATQKKPAESTPLRVIGRKDGGSRQRRTEYNAIKGRLHRQLLDELDDGEIFSGDEVELTARVEQFVQDVLDTEDLPLSEAERERLPEEILEETLGVGPLASLMGDPTITDILVNRYNEVYIERFGQLEETNVSFRDNNHLLRIIQRIAAQVGRHIDEATPMLDTRLPDGSRVNATLPPVSLDGPTVSIRRFGRRRFKRFELLERQMFSPEIDRFFSLIVKSRLNVLVSGGTGSGKTTLLGAVCEVIPQRERVVTIEDAAELQLDQPHVIRLESRPPNIERQGKISQRDLVINALRMRPDRIIVGEVRSGEALDMLQAMNTGHDGSLTTVHANSPRDAVSRLETLVLMAGLDLPSRAIREQIAAAIDVIIQVRRYEDGVRRIESIAELTGMEDAVPQLQDIFVFKQTGFDGKRVLGQFKPTGVVPRFVERLRRVGVDVPSDLFTSSEI